MELTKDISAEKVHFPKETNILNDIAQEAKELTEFQIFTKKQLLEKIANILSQKIADGDKTAYFQLGLHYFEQGVYEKAFKYFDSSKDFDFQSLYQISVMRYDGIGCTQDTFKGVEYMMGLSQVTSQHARHLLPAVRFNIGRAYFQGFGVRRQSDTEAEKWWLLAADDGNPKASIKAQSVLGMFYSREGEYLDFKKAFFWHSEACGNGSLESQGALGVMYMYGIGLKKDMDAAYICLKDAADRGNVCAMGNLVLHYYQQKLYTKAADLASKVAELKDVELIAQDTDCLPAYIKKGISMACFLFARCLSQGLGIKQNKGRAKEFYSRSFSFDPDICARFQNITQHGLL